MHTIGVTTLTNRKLQTAEAELCSVQQLHPTHSRCLASPVYLMKVLRHRLKISYTWLSFFCVAVVFVGRQCQEQRMRANDVAKRETGKQRKEDGIQFYL